MKNPEEKTTLTESKKTDRRTDGFKAFFKLFLDFLLPLKILLHYIGLWLCLFPTLGVPALLYNNFKYKKVLFLKINLNLGILFSLGYIGLEFFIGIAIYLFVKGQKKRPNLFFDD